MPKESDKRLTPADLRQRTGLTQGSIRGFDWKKSLSRY
jgi:hypothetical protein